MWILLLSVLVSTTSTTSGLDAQSFSYADSNGPRQWPLHFEDCGKKNLIQSPIDLIEADAVKITFLPIVIVPNRVGKMRIENNGHTVQMTFVDPKQLPTIVGGPLTYKYKFAQMHFHWPSETHMNGTMFDLELHMVFYCTYYASFDAAAKSGNHDALLVFASVFRVSRRNRRSFDFTTKLRDIQYVSNATIHDFENMEFTAFLPRSIQSYFTFQGSLTTPPCSAITTWIVVKMIGRVSDAQLKRFLNIHNARGEVVQHNCRDIQPLDGRKVNLNVPGRRFTMDRPLLDALDVHNTFLRRPTIV